MSRIGNKPVPVPAGVKVALEGRRLTISGPRAKQGLSQELLPGISVKLDEKAQQLRVERESDSRELRARHGLTRALIANMVRGVSEGFEKTLELIGLGYTVKLEKGDLVCQLGFCHPITYRPPEGIELQVPRPTQIVVRGADRQLVGQVAASIRSFRPPEPYKGKGLRYEGEEVRRKAGKTFVSGGG